MGKISSTNVAQARLAPEAEFDSPRDVVTSQGLTRGQKIATLDRWLDVVQQRLDATSEGMPPSGTTDSDMRLVDEIRVALRDLRTPAPTEQ